MSKAKEPPTMAASPRRLALVRPRAEMPRSWHKGRRLPGAAPKLAVAAGFVLSGLSVQVLADDFKKLSDIQIKRLITGKVMTDDVHYRDQFLPGGKYEGVSVGKSFSGTWEVSDGELCITRRVAEKPDCNEIWQSRKDAMHVELRKSWQREGNSAVVLPK